MQMRAGGNARGAVSVMSLSSAVSSVASTSSAPDPQPEPSSTRAIAPKNRYIHFASCADVDRCIRRTIVHCVTGYHRGGTAWICWRETDAARGRRGGRIRRPSLLGGWRRGRGVLGEICELLGEFVEQFLELLDARLVLVDIG